MGQQFSNFKPSDPEHESLLLQFEELFTSEDDQIRIQLKNRKRFNIEVITNAHQALIQGVSVFSVQKYYELNQIQIISVLNLLTNTKFKTVSQFMQFRSQERKRKYLIKYHYNFNAATQKIQNKTNLKDVQKIYGLTNEELLLL
ncbi:Hypothetical_protein [Hexamita inflata]|uniref:Hypothetical_protein n=1 Tax=Hexamita inflata TaxID=28002 RepID=A0ABP1JS26_9EUKA